MRLSIVGKRGRLACLFGTGTCAVLLAFSIALANSGDGVVLAHGNAGPESWRVTVTGDGQRKGVCLEVAVLKQKGKAGGSANGRCSAPAVRRGLLRAVVRRKASGRPRLTVIGGALNQRVNSVSVDRLTGGTQSLRLRRVASPPKGEAQVGRYKYIALSVKGPWCIRDLVTRAASGAVLWRVSGKEILPYGPERFC